MTSFDLLKPAEIDVLDVRPVSNAGNVRAFVSVRLGPLVIHSCKVVQQPGQRAWVSLPQTQNDGRYWPVIEITNPDLLAQVRGAILNRWAERYGDRLL
jgi:DNA-binding cell septation regulator SpoVG